VTQTEDQAAVVRRLLMEIKRLMIENERLRAENKNLKAGLRATVGDNE
jgi:regulator of replication initiation timing